MNEIQNLRSRLDAVRARKSEAEAKLVRYAATEEAILAEIAEHKKALDAAFAEET